MPFGTLSITDLLSNQATIAQLGEDLVYNAIQIALDAHNEIVAEMLDPLVERTTDRLRRYGGLDSMHMEEIDEFGTPDAQKISAGQNIGFPMRLYGTAVQWTRRYMMTATGKEIAEQFVAIQDADVRNIITQVRKTLFTPTNSSPVDRLFQPALTLPVKALVNADGAPIAPNPVTAATFNSATHTHFMGVATPGTVVAADLDALINNVLEHYGRGNLVIYVNQAQEALIRAVAGFVAYVDPRQITATTVTIARGDLDVSNTFDRRIGIYKAAEIWVKPWIPANYMLAWDSAGNAYKPLVMRTRLNGTGDLVIAYEDEEYPLRARGVEREFGLGVWNRTNGAIMETDASSYSVPANAALIA